MNFAIDKYQENAFNVIEQNDISIISGPKSSGKSHLIRYMARKQWDSSKNCLIIVPESEQGDLMYKLLGAFDLSRYCSVFDGNDDTFRFNIARIKALLREEKIEISKKDLSTGKLKTQSLREKIAIYYATLNQALIQDKSFSDLLTITSFDTNSYTNIHFNQIFDSGKFDFSEEEFASISGSVKTAFELYLKGENKNDVYFSKKAYEGDSADRSWKMVARWIEESRIKILKSIELLSVFMNEQVNRLFDQEWSDINEIVEAAHECLVSCNAFMINFQDFTPKSSGLFGLDKKSRDQNEQYQLALQKIQLEYKTLLEKLYSNERIKDNYLLPEWKESKIEDIWSQLETIVNDLDKFEMILLNSINKELKSINFRNIRNEHTENLQAELENLFAYLNDGFTIKKWEDTAFSINKQLNYLESILEDLNESEGQKSNFFSNYQWNSFILDQEEKSIYIIKKLNIYRPKNWLTFLKNWYIQNIILKYQKKFKTDISNLIEEYMFQVAHREELNKLKSAKIWQNKREIHISKVEDQKNNILNRLIRKEEITADELLSNPGGFLTVFTPLVIMTAEVFEKHRDQAGDCFDMIMFHNCDEIKEKLEFIIPEQSSSKMVFFEEDHELAANIKNVLWKKSYQNRTAEAELKGFHQMGMIELIDMNNTERLYAARNIACLMQFSNPDIKIYHIKNKIIFSALDPLMNKVLLKLLQPHGVKEMKIIDTPYHLLVDSLLEINNKQILIIQNNLLNYREPDDLIRQVYSLEKIRKAGIKIMNFNTSDLLNEPVRTIKDFVSGI